MRPVYLDCCATTPLDPAVRDVLLNYLDIDYGNEGSRTHVYGSRAKVAVQNARSQIADCVGACPEEVIFTSGATESNNIAILGLSNGLGNKIPHVITTAIEHKAVLEPIEALARSGADITVLKPRKDGRVDPKDLARALRPETLIVSVMHANNETGVIQPIDELAEVLSSHLSYFHVDSAQGIGMFSHELRNKRIDLISISGHKVFAPKGVGCLIARRRGYRLPPLQCLQYGGGQERSIRPGTLPVAQIAALGEAVSQCVKQREFRYRKCMQTRDDLLNCFTELGAELIGNQEFALPHVVSLRIPNIDSEALMLATKDLIAISNGSACTSSRYSPSHVLTSMGMCEQQANECVRISWCHLTDEIPWESIRTRIRSIL